jgi:hypothetical protein
MMPAPQIHHRTDPRHFGRLSPGNAPACPGSRVWPVGAPRFPRSKPPSARSPHYPCPSFEPRQPGRRSRLNFPKALADLKSP